MGSNPTPRTSNTSIAANLDPRKIICINQSTAAYAASEDYTSIPMNHDTHASHEKVINGLTVLFVILSSRSSDLYTKSVSRAQLLLQQDKILFALPKGIYKPIAQR
ncbi:MAG: hypothetical protein N3D82_05775 [Ignisphaera sp.]|nr:hypothetical protein [Ignisphaera sp.]